MGIWVEAIVVSSNRKATVHISNPTIPILKLQQLPNYLSHMEALENSAVNSYKIGKELAKQKA